jgi:hypothetical protein
MTSKSKLAEASTPMNCSDIYFPGRNCSERSTLRNPAFPLESHRPRLLCVISTALSVWSFADGEYSTAGLQLAFAVFWPLAASWDKLPAVPGRWHDG